MQSMNHLQMRLHSSNTAETTNKTCKTRFGHLIFRFRTVTQAKSKLSEPTYGQGRSKCQLVPVFLQGRSKCRQSGKFSHQLQVANTKSSIQNTQGGLPHEENVRIRANLSCGVQALNLITHDPQIFDWVHARRAKRFNPNPKNKEEVACLTPPSPTEARTAMDWASLLVPTTGCIHCKNGCENCDPDILFGSKV